MDFLSNSVYGVPILLILILWFIFTQVNKNNSGSRSKSSFRKEVKCINCSEKINSKATKCFYCKSDQNK
jgi:hypothetical protein